MSTNFDSIGKWARGDQYGPVLSQTDLYLLNIPLELHPILRNVDNNFHLSFDLSTGETSGFDPGNRDRDLPFTQRDQPATMPRVAQINIITPWSPWCTIIINENGVTLGDICIKLWQDYSQNTISEAELNSLPPRMQEYVRRAAQNNVHNASQNQWGQSPYYTPAPVQVPPNQYKRYDWLRDHVMFDFLVKDPAKDAYIKSRLGYTAPNIFVMELAA